MKRLWIRRFLALLLACFTLLGSAALSQDAPGKPEKQSNPSFQTDSSSKGSAPGNLRLLKKGLYTFRDASRKYGINDLVPNEQGMDDLYISGSEQYALPQFMTLAEMLRREAGDREIWVFDLRRESHAVMGDVAVSWYETHNWGNTGLTVEEIEADELSRFVPLIGQSLKHRGRFGKEEKKIPIKGFLREREMVESAGFHYYRLPIADHTWPTPEQIDEFIAFVKGIDMDRVWIHFHCRAGVGRTGVMMMLYDKMKNPEVPITDIAVRQARLGAEYPLYTSDADNYKTPLYAEKAEMTPLLGRYVEENHASGYQVSWSDWLKEQKAAEAVSP